MAGRRLAQSAHYEIDSEYESVFLTIRQTGRRVLIGDFYGDVEKAVKYGNAVSAMKNTIPGDLPQSTLPEIDAVIADHYSTGFHSEMNR